MHKLGWLLAGAVTATAVGLAAPRLAHAANPTWAAPQIGGIQWGVGPDGGINAVALDSTGAQATSNAPMSPQTPVLFPDGGPISVAASTSQCALIGAGRRFELTCKVGDCDCRRVAQNTDGGWAAVASPSDGGASWVVFAGRR